MKMNKYEYDWNWSKAGLVMMRENFTKFGLYASNKIQYTEWRMNKYKYNYMHNFAFELFYTSYVTKLHI